MEGESKTSVHVRCLPNNMTEKEVFDLFSQIGEIQSCYLKRDRESGASLNYAFVNYLEPKNAELAISQLNGIRLQNRKLKVRFAKHSLKPITNLYVGGIPKKTRIRDFENWFSPFGKIVSSRILRHRNGSEDLVTDGFIMFDKQVAAERAVRYLNGTIPAGATHPIVVRLGKYNYCDTKTTWKRKPMAEIQEPTSSRALPAPIVQPTGNFCFPPLTSYPLDSDNSTD